jgi:hypothetical protein
MGFWTRHDFGYSMGYWSAITTEAPTRSDRQETRRGQHETVRSRLEVGDEVLRLVYRPDKMEPRAVGPYRITRVHSNGTITIELSPGVVERINIRRVKPYHRWKTRLHWTNVQTATTERCCLVFALLAEWNQWVSSIKVSSRVIYENRGLVLRSKVPLGEGFSPRNGSPTLLMRWPGSPWRQNVVSEDQWLNDHERDWVVPGR